VIVLSATADNGDISPAGVSVSPIDRTGEFTSGYLGADDGCSAVIEL